MMAFFIFSSIDEVQAMSNNKTKIGGGEEDSGGEVNTKSTASDFNIPPGYTDICFQNYIDIDFLFEISYT